MARHRIDDLAATKRAAAEQPGDRFARGARLAKPDFDRQATARRHDGGDRIEVEPGWFIGIGGLCRLAGRHLGPVMRHLVDELGDMPVKTRPGLRGAELRRRVGRLGLRNEVRFGDQPGDRLETASGGEIIGIARRRRNGEAGADRPGRLGCCRDAGIILTIRFLVIIGDDGDGGIWKALPQADRHPAKIAGIHCGDDHQSGGLSTEAPVAQPSQMRIVCAPSSRPPIRQKWPALAPPARCELRQPLAQRRGKLIAAPAPGSLVKADDAMRDPVQRYRRNLGQAGHGAGKASMGMQ